MQLGRTPDELLDTLSARHLLQFRQLYEEHLFGPESDDWRAALLMSAMNGKPPSENLPKWQFGPVTEPILDLGFGNVCNALKRGKG